MLVLVAALFEPIAERRYDEKIRGRVVLGVDLSESMATADPVAAGEDPRSSPAEPAPTVARREIARRLLKGEWFQQIAADHNVAIVGFARDAVDGTPETVAQARREARWFRRSGRARHRLERRAGQGVQGGDSGPVMGVVLLTDGRQNVPVDPGRAPTGWPPAVCRFIPC